MLVRVERFRASAVAGAFQCLQQRVQSLDPGVGVRPGGPQHRRFRCQCRVLAARGQHQRLQRLDVVREFGRDRRHAADSSTADGGVRARSRALSHPAAESAERRRAPVPRCLHPRPVHSADSDPFRSLARWASGSETELKRTFAADLPLSVFRPSLDSLTLGPPTVSSSRQGMPLTNLQITTPAPSASGCRRRRCPQFSALVGRWPEREMLCARRPTTFQGTTASPG